MSTVKTNSNCIAFPKVKVNVNKTSVKHPEVKHQQLDNVQNVI